MLVRDYNLSDLVDLALITPERGQVNFNILHTILQCIIEEMNLAAVKPWCNIENPDIARASLASAKRKAMQARRSLSQESRPIHSSKLRPILPSIRSGRRASHYEEPQLTRDEEHAESDEEELEEVGTAAVADERTAAVSDERSEVQQEEEKTPLEISGREEQEQEQESKDSFKGVESEYDQAETSEVADVGAGHDEESAPTTADVERVHEKQAPTSRRFAKQKYDRSAPRDRDRPFRRDQRDAQSASHQPTMSDMYRTTNIDKRLDAAEHMLMELSSTVDAFMSKVHTIDEKTSISEGEIDTLRNDVERVLSNMNEMSENNPSREEFDSLKARTDIVEEEKLDKDAVARTIEELFGGSNLMEQLKQQGADTEETLKYLMNYLGVNYVPESQRTEGESEETEEEKYVMPPVNERIDEICRQVDEMAAQLKQSTSVMDSKKIADHDTLIRTVVDHLDNVKMKIQLFENENKRKEKAFMDLQNDVGDLNFSKADKDEVSKALDLKADKKELDYKVSKTEFLATVEDLGESIEELVNKFEANDVCWRSEVEELKTEVKLKLRTDDYMTLQEPIKNRIRAMLYAIKKLKSVIYSSLHPDAAAVTKCVSCGRPAEIATGKCKPSGDANCANFNKSPPTNKEHECVSDSTPAYSNEDDDDDSESGKSFIKVPESAVEMREIHSEPESHTSDRSLKDDIGLQKRMSKREIDNKFDQLLATSPNSRFCGASHTQTRPQQRGVKFVDVEIPSMPQELINLVGYDKVTYYRGAVPAERVDQLPPDVDPKSVNMDQIVESCYGAYPQLPPRDTTAPRYCGGMHTVIQSPRKDKGFSFFNQEESSLSLQVDLMGVDGSIYRGAINESTPIPCSDSVAESFPNKYLQQAKGQQKGKQAYQTKIINFPCGNIRQQFYPRKK